MYNCPKQIPSIIVPTWDAMLKEQLFKVPWSGFDCQGDPIFFSDLQFYPDANDRHTIRIVGKNNNGVEIFTGTYDFNSSASKVKFNESDYFSCEWEVSAGKFLTPKIL